MEAQAMPSGGAISRQGSACSLTLSEVEGQLNGVNLDDLLRRAGSAAAAARRTVDEVWLDIQGSGGGDGDGGGGGVCVRPTPDQMTLEDFLSRSRDVVAAADAPWAQQYYPQPDPPPEQQQHQNHVGRPLPRPLGVSAGPVLDALYHDGATLSGRKRAAGGGPGEKTVERRKKRMIKNRESAARSRARKLAYTNELEIKVSRLEEENKRLKKQKEFIPIVPFVPQVKTKSQIGRRNSASF